jgi:hypothetical protein
MAKRTLKSARSGSRAGRSDRAALSPPNSTNSAPPSNGSKRRYVRPVNAQAFAAQANDVCTRLLNGEIEQKLAQTYASLARVVSQTLSAQVTKARFLKEAPDLSLELPEGAVDE